MLKNLSHFSNTANQHGAIVASLLIFRRTIMRPLSLDAINLVKHSLQACLENKATFLEHVKAVASVRVVSYEVDLLARKVIYQFAEGESHVESLPPTKAHFDPGFFAKDIVRSAIEAVRAQSIDYPTFLDRIVSAGTKGYEVNFDEAKVTYKGESENHIEVFPKFT